MQRQEIKAIAKISDIQGAVTPNVHDEGSSYQGLSASFAKHVLDLEPLLFFSYHHPYDADDLSRCMVVFENYLRNSSPGEEIQLLSPLAQHGAFWATIVSHYPQLKALYLQNADPKQITYKMHQYRDEYIVAKITERHRQFARDRIVEIESKLEQEMKEAVFPLDAFFTITLDRKRNPEELINLTNACNIEAHRKGFVFRGIQVFPVHGDYYSHYYAGSEKGSPRLLDQYENQGELKIQMTLYPSNRKIETLSRKIAEEKKVSHSEEKQKNKKRKYESQSSSSFFQKETDKQSDQPPPTKKRKLNFEKEFEKA